MLKAPQAVLMDAESGGVMYQRNGDELMYPASMSKLMLLAVVFKALKAGEVKLEDEFFMSEYAWRKGGAPSGTSAMFVPVGTKADGRRADQGHHRAVGQRRRHLDGREHGRQRERCSPRRMTEEARQLGLKKSVFKNATGLFHPEHQMTARELAMLARHIIKTYPDYYPLFSQRDFVYRKHKFFNRNPLLGLVAGVDGLKTGHIKEAGHGIVASAKQDNRRLIVVVNGARHRGRAPGRGAPAAGVGLQQLLGGQALRRRRGGRPRPRLGRRAHVRAAGRRGRRQRLAAAQPGRPEAQGAHRLQVAAEAAA